MPDLEVDEVEVTPEMIAAARLILRESDEPPTWQGDDMVAVIYRVMEAERRNPGSGERAALEACAIRAEIESLILNYVEDMRALDVDRLNSTTARVLALAAAPAPETSIGNDVPR